MSSSLHVPAGEERLITVSPLTTHTHLVIYILVPVADLGGVRGVHLHPPLAGSNVFLRT